MDDFSDFDDLLAEAEAEAGARTAEKELRAKVKRTPEGEAKAQAIADLKLIDEKFNWTSIEAVAVFDRQSCACGAQHTAFVGTFIKQRHKHFDATRLVNTALGALGDTPRKVEMNDTRTPICVICALGKGFAL